MASIKAGLPRFKPKDKENVEDPRKLAIRRRLAARKEEPEVPNTQDDTIKKRKEYGF